jgi:probable HAF family extracellular repeat protein
MKRSARKCGRSGLYLVAMVAGLLMLWASRAWAVDYTATDLGTLGSSGTTFTYANGINNSGTIVGFSSTTSGGAEDAFVYSGGVMTDLEPYLASIGLTGVNLAKAIDDNGDIVGNGDDSAGNTHAFLLTPQVPEPGCLGIVGLVGFMAMAKRRRRVQLV